MTLNQLIAIAAFAVPCATALLVGYWHRKQMRQVELFRRDPKVGVLPAPSPPVAFFKQYRSLILGVGMPMLSLAFLIARNGPVTNGSAALISFNFACILINLQCYSEMRLLKLFDKLLDIQSSVILKVNEAQMRLTELARQKGLKEIAPNTGRSAP